MTTPTGQTTTIRGGRLLDARAHRADPGDILVRFLRGRGMKTGWGVVGDLSLFCLVGVAQAQPSAEQVLTDAGLSAGDRQSVMGGQFVNVSAQGVSERDLAFAIAFLVKTPPETLAKQIVAGELVTADEQVKAYGEISGEGSLADFAKLTLTGDEAKALAGAKAGDKLQKYVPAFQKVLLDYPQAALPGLQERFFWTKSLIQGETTYVLNHVLVAADGAARVVARRQYYASTGYNAEQSVAGFLPVQGGTVAITTSHAFSDQVSGMGGSVKRGIGSKIMASKMKDIYEAARERSQQKR